MGNFWEKYTSSNLIFRIALGLILGTCLGHFVPQAPVIDQLGILFVGALKAIAPVLVFVLVSSSLLGSGGGKSRKQIGTVIFLYILSTLVSASVAVAVSFAFPVTVPLSLTEQASGVAPTGISQVFSNLLVSIVTNPVKSLVEANYLGILFWAVMFGLAMNVFATPSVANGMRQIADSVSQIVRWIIQLAPFGIMGIVFTSVSSNGVGIFVNYGKLLAVLVGCMLFVAFVVTPLIVGVTMRSNPFPLVLACYKKSGLTAFFTRSSAANIPVNMEIFENLGLNRNLYSVSLPLGATINMNGAAITITVMTLATVNTLGLTVDVPTAIILSLLATAGACGASGVAGGSLLLIPMACSLFGISNDLAMQVVGIGFIIGVIQDSFETALNSSTDVIYAAASEFRQWKMEGRSLKDITF